MDLLKAEVPEEESRVQPLFTNRGGTRLSKEEVVKEVELFATRQGLPLRKPNGKKAFGGHCLRISAAVFAFHGGATDQEGCDLGGWRSVEVMRKYLRSAFL